MKTITALAFLFFCTVLSLTAQRSSLFVGFNGGANASKIKFTGELSDLYSNTRSATGVNGGLVFGAQLGSIMIGSGIQYIQKGGEYQTENFQDEKGTGFFTARERFHVVSVPILLGYRKLLGDQFGLSVALGPSLNFGLSGKNDETIEYFNSEEPQNTNYTVRFGDGINDDYRGMQVGFQFSPGMFFDFNERSRLTLNVTWDTGLADMFNPRYKSANSFFDDYRGTALSRTAMFSIGFERHFSLGDRY